MPVSPTGQPGDRLRSGGGPRWPARALTIATAALAGLLVAIPAGAAATERPAGHPGLAMAISPPRLTVPAGQVTKVQRLEVENRGHAVLHVHTELSAFAQLANGSTKLQPKARYSAVNWITVTPARFQVRAGQRRYVQIRIHVPANAEPGDHHVAIVFLVPDSPRRGNIHIAAGIGVPTVITVPGPITDHLRVLKLTAPSVSAGGPLRISATVRETGDVHHSFRGRQNRLIAIAGRTRILFPPLTVLRGSTVTFVSRWTDPPRICLCRITTTVASGLGRQTASATILIFPVIPVLVTIAVIAALVTAFVIARRRQVRRLAAAYEAGRRGSLRRVPGTQIRPADLPVPGVGDYLP
jgi:hypothetical protein